MSRSAGKQESYESPEPTEPGPEDQKRERAAPQDEEQDSGEVPGSNEDSPEEQEPERAEPEESELECEPINGKDLLIRRLPILTLASGKKPPATTDSSTRNLLPILAVLLLLLAGALFLYTRLVGSPPGERVEFGPEEIFYREGATESDALRLGDYLRQIGTFDGNSEKTAVLSGDSEGYTVQFIVRQEAFEDQALLTATFEMLADRISANVFEGKPVTVELCDGQLEVRQSLQGSGVRWLDPGVGFNEVFLRGQATVPQGEALAAYFRQIGLFTDESRTSIVLEREADQIHLLFVFTEEAWDDSQDLLPTFSALARSISQEVFGGGAVTVDLADGELKVRATVSSQDDMAERED
ncbi:MAG: hypothetical protein JW797_15275 [Bradymonadales bacterium]|nr:hypothetical protein [Bradymonadales bacterium]